MQHPGWVLVIVGAVLLLAGAVWLVAPSIPWIGRLPGDIAIERPNFRFYFPLATCVIVSLVVTGLLWLARYFTGR